MQTKLINIKPRLSKIWLVATLLISLIIISISIFFASYLGFIFITLYFLAFSLRAKYQLYIDTKNSKFTLYKNNKAYEAILINCHQITFLLTMITLKYSNSKITIPIYLDSVPINEYKNLRMFLQWN
jgi:hypothetical protein